MVHGALDVTRLCTSYTVTVMGLQHSGRVNGGRGKRERKARECLGWQGRGVLRSAQRSSAHLALPASFRTSTIHVQGVCCANHYCIGPLQGPNTIVSWTLENAEPGAAARGQKLLAKRTCSSLPYQGAMKPHQG